MRDSLLSCNFVGANLGSMIAHYQRRYQRQQEGLVWRRIEWTKS
jgi:hypothetical protein